MVTGEAEQKTETAPETPAAETTEAPKAEATPQPAASETTTATEAKVEATPEPKESPEVARLKAELETERQNKRTAEGRLKAESPRIARLERLMLKNIPEEEREAAIKEADAAAQQDEGRRQVEEEINFFYEDWRNLSKKMGKDLETDPAFERVRELRSQNRFGSANRMMVTMYEQYQDDQAEGKRVAKATRHESVPTPAPRPAATAGTPSLAQLAAMDTRRMTPAQLKEHDSLLDRAMRAGG